MLLPNSVATASRCKRDGRRLALSHTELALVENPLRALLQIEARAAELAAMESVDSGKTLKMATNVDIPRSIANFR